MRLDVAGHDDLRVHRRARRSTARRPAIVFLHGAANDHSVWALQSRYFAHHGFDTLAVDLPGHGRSAGAPLASVEAIADWVPRLLDAAADRARIARRTLAWCAGDARRRVTSSAGRVERIALLGPAIPMAVSDGLLEAARTNDPVAYELIVGWSHSAARSARGNPVPGMWMAGTALQLMNRSRTGALYTDLMRAQPTAAGSMRRPPCAVPRSCCSERGT